MKSSQLVANVRLVYCVNATRFLNVASQALGDITHFSDFFDLGFCPNSDYSISAARARCTIILAGDSHCFWFFSALSFSDKMMVSIHIICLFDSPRL